MCHHQTHLSTCSEDNQNSLDKIQNSALRLVNTPTAACEIHANVEPLGKRREKVALELVFEKTKSTSCDNPTMVDNWEPK